MTTMTTTDEDGHHCHRRDQDSRIAVECGICGDTDDVRLCTVSVDGCGQVYCAVHHLPYCDGDCHADEALRIWDAARGGPQGGPQLRR